MRLAACSLTLGLLLCYPGWHQLMASSTLSNEDISQVKRRSIDSEDLRQKIENSAVLLANYEIEAKKLVRLAEKGGDSERIRQQAVKLMDLSETVIDSARFRLPQCDEYLAMSIALRSQLQEISHASLERDYHHDGALPEAPAECYHAKDLFIHPATVLVLTRDDPQLKSETRLSIKAEISEVLAHTEFVRQLVLY